jgi:hypothetical protein
MDNESSCIYSISSEQLNKISTYKEKWLSIAQESEAASPEELRHAIYYLYQAIGLKLPKIHIFDSPCILKSTVYKKTYNGDSPIDRFVKLFLTTYLIIIASWIIFHFIISPFITTATIAILTILVYLIFIYCIIESAARKKATTLFFQKPKNYLKSPIVWGFVVYFTTIVSANPLIKIYDLEGIVSTSAILWGIGLLLAYWLIKTCMNKIRVAHQGKYLLDKQIQFSLCPSIRQQISTAFEGGWETIRKTIIGEEYIDLQSDQDDIWSYIRWYSWADFCITELECDCDRRLWQSLKIIITSCSTIIADRHACYISDRPLYVHVDDQHRLHAKDKPAVSFADNTHFYYRHGKRLPLPDLPW